MQEPDIEYVEGYEELEEEEDMEDLGNFALGETGADDDDGKIAFDRTLYVFDYGDTMDVEIYSNHLYWWDELVNMLFFSRLF